MLQRLPLPHAPSLKLPPADTFRLFPNERKNHEQSMD
ncbi:hypothetical protein KPSA1_03479 [Pseudomonas syringae pv. actinidiae]|uniref:Uncharacterized protein n=1 Tax=Pseudomonas syringae pv. actinidiae TaxID=103796 RepID=A0A2V0QN89_PSESF|nr:hypothetical protein KPSA1_03479 [Pseudomonas syringae pv. actinidiae]